MDNFKVTVEFLSRVINRNDVFTHHKIDVNAKDVQDLVIALYTSQTVSKVLDPEGTVLKAKQILQSKEYNDFHNAELKTPEEPPIIPVVEKGVEFIN